MGRTRDDTPEGLVKETMEKAHRCAPICGEMVERMLRPGNIGVLNDDGSIAIDNRRRADVLAMLPWIARNLCSEYRSAEEGVKDASVVTLYGKLWSPAGGGKRGTVFWNIRTWERTNGTQIESMTLEMAIEAVKLWIPEDEAACHDDDGPSAVVPAVQVVSWRDGGRIDRLVDYRQFAAEGNAMNHCIGGSNQGTCEADGRSDYWQKSRDGQGGAFSYRYVEQQNPYVSDRLLGLPEGTIWFRLDPLRLTDAYGFDDQEIEDRVARERLVRFLVSTPGAPQVPMVLRTSHLEPFRSELGVGIPVHHVDLDEEDEDHDEDDYDEGNHDEDDEHQEHGVPGALPADLLPEMPGEPEGAHAEMVATANLALTQAVNELRTRLAQGMAPTDALAAPSEVDVPFPGGPYPNWFIVVGCLESLLRGRFGIQGRRGEYFYQQRPWDEDDPAISITLGADGTQHFEIEFDPIFDPSSQIPGLQGVPVVPAWLRNLGVDSVGVRFDVDPDREQPTDILLEVDLYRGPDIIEEMQAPLDAFLGPFAEKFTEIVRERGDAEEDAEIEPEAEDDLPAPIDLWLIDTATGRIEAWDDPQNPHTGDDVHALGLARQAVAADAWTHPVYNRVQALEALGLHDGGDEIEDDDGDVDEIEQFGADYEPDAGSELPDIILVPPNLIFGASRNLMRGIGHDSPSGRGTALFIPYPDEENKAWTISSRDRAIELYVQHELRGRGPWPSENGSLLIILPHASGSLPGATPPVDVLFAELNARFPGGLAIALEDLDDRMVARWRRTAERNDIPIFETASEAIEDHREAEEE